MVQNNCSIYLFIVATEIYVNMVIYDKKYCIKLIMFDKENSQSSI